MEDSMNLRHWIAPALAAAIATASLPSSICAQSHVPTANGRVTGSSAPNVLSPELLETIVAQGNMKLENTSTLTSYYGYDNDGTFVPTGTPSSEASKTEPDKNTYLVLRGQTGADPHYDYGRHFIFQGHESGLASPAGSAEQGYITRINLDADGAHRVTLMAYLDSTGKPLPDFDGSTWYPFSEKLLFTAELSGTTGGVWQMSPEFSLSPVVEDISGVLGRGGYEGIQADDHGNLFIVEDASGSTGSATASLTHARQPNSFIYRFIPSNPSNLKDGGKLQVLQVINPLPSAHTVVFHAGQADADILSADVKDLHTYGRTFATRWITIHDTVNGFTSFDANALAKSNGGTPFKRPENGQFRPGSGFSEFVFTETGDTSALTEAGAAYGGFGGLFRLRTFSGDNGALSLLYLGDVQHTGFDNLSFWDDDKVVVVEDAGDTLHGQRNALDSAYLFDVRLNYGNPSNQPVRILAQGRDASATVDTLVQFPFNDGDNEITGWHESDGNPSISGLIGTRVPTPFRNGWRVFYTQQHGDNITYEILPKDPEDFEKGGRGTGRGHDKDDR